MSDETEKWNNGSVISKRDALEPCAPDGGALDDDLSILRKYINSQDNFSIEAHDALARISAAITAKSTIKSDNTETLYNALERIEQLEAIPTKQLVEMLKDPPEDVDWTGDLGLFKRAAWRIEELDGIFSPRFIVPRAGYNGRVHEAVNEAMSAFIKHQHTIRYNDRWLKPEEYQLSIGACGEMIQAYLDFFTAVQDGEENPAPENTIDAIIRAEQKGQSHD